MSQIQPFTPEHAFDATLELDGESGGVFVLIPFDVKEAYGTRSQVKVLSTFDGFPYEGSLTPISDGHHVLVVPKQIRNAIGKSWGEDVHVELARDTTPRVVEVSDEFARALAAVPGAREKFNQMAYSHQREYTRWIEAAKKSEIKYERMRKAVEMISAGRKRG
jgi:hypothetical protein